MFVSALRTSVLSIALLFSASASFANSGLNEATSHIENEDILVVDGDVIVKVGYGYGVKITFEPGTSDEAIRLVVKSARQVINDSDVQAKALEIFIATGSAYKAAKYVAGKVVQKVIESVVISIKLVKVD